MRRLTLILASLVLAVFSLASTLVIGPTPNSAEMPMLGTMVPGALPSYPCYLQSWIEQPQAVGPPKSNQLWSVYDGRTPPWWWGDVARAGKWRTNVYRASPTALPRKLENNGDIIIQNLGRPDRQTVIDLIVVRQPWTYIGIAFRNCQNLSVVRIVVEGDGDWNAPVGRGYGVMIESCFGITIADVRAVGCRNGVRVHNSKRVLIGSVSIPWRNDDKEGWGRFSAVVVQGGSQDVEVRRTIYTDRPAGSGEPWFMNQLGGTPQWTPKRVKLPAPIRVNPTTLEIGETAAAA